MSIFFYCLSQIKEREKEKEQKPKQLEKQLEKNWTKNLLLLNLNAPYRLTRIYTYIYRLMYVDGCINAFKVFTYTN